MRRVSKPYNFKRKPKKNKKARNYKGKIILIWMIKALISKTLKNQA